MKTEKCEHLRLNKVLGGPTNAPGVAYGSKLRKFRRAGATKLRCHGR